MASSALLTPKNRRRRIPHLMKPIPNAYRRYRESVKGFGVKALIGGV